MKLTTRATIQNKVNNERRFTCTFPHVFISCVKSRTARNLPANHRLIFRLLITSCLPETNISFSSLFSKAFSYQGTIIQKHKNQQENLLGNLNLYSLINKMGGQNVLNRKNLPFPYGAGYLKQKMRNSVVSTDTVSTYINMLTAQTIEY